MIEVKRRLYLDEKTETKLDSFVACRRTIGRLVDAVRRAQGESKAG
jgi:hypothetical protein